jgi:SAM-dependent methyltransferase
MTDATPPGRFGAEYWQEQTHYGRLGDYAAALEATKRWYLGLLRLIGRHLPVEGRHLDVGCGHGAMVHLMLERGLDARGFDASEWMIEQARAVHPELADRFAVGDAAGPFPFEGPFALITAIEVVEHLPEPKTALMEMRQRLAPGGTLVMTTPNPRNFMPFRNPAFQDPTHVNVHEPDWWRGVLRDADFVVEDDCTYLGIPFLWRRWPALSRFIRFENGRAPGWVAVCRPV